MEIMDIIQIPIREIKNEKENKSKISPEKRAYFSIFHQYILLAIFIKIWYTYCYKYGYDGRRI